MNDLILNRFDNSYTVRLEIGSYQDNCNLAISIEALLDGEWESWSSLTVNLTPQLSPNTAFIDTNNNGNEIMQWLSENGMGITSGMNGHSGYCQYPHFIFFEDKLREISEAGYARHLKRWMRRQSQKK